MTSIPITVSVTDSAGAKATTTVTANVSASSGYNNLTNDPGPTNRPAYNSSIGVLTWIGPTGGGASTANDAVQSLTLTKYTTNGGSYVANTNGVIIQGLYIPEGVTINANNVTLRRCAIARQTTSNITVVQCNGSGATVEDCEIWCPAGYNGNNYAILGATISQRNNIHTISAGQATSGTSTVQAKILDNWEHDFANSNTSAGPHFDGLFIANGNTNILVQHNFINNNQVQTDAVMIQNWNGPVSNIIVNNNRLLSHGYVVYVDNSHGGGPITNISITDNRIGVLQPMGYGPFFINTSGVNLSGNVDDVTGNPIP